MTAQALAQPSEQDIQKILRGITIPSPPQVIADLQMEMAMPEPDLNAMSKLIASDVGLAGGVLKTVNSPLYGGRGRITSIQRAVMVLGMNTVVGIVNALSLRNTMLAGEKTPEQLFAAMTRFWDSAADVAQACVLVAQKLRMPATDSFYTLGLFHNVGIPLLMQKFDNYPEIMRDSYASAGQRIIDVENQQLDTNHAVLGIYVARSWRLPQLLCDVIGQHHNVQLLSDADSEQSELCQLLRILKMAEHIAGLYRVLGDQDRDAEWERVGEEICQAAGLSQYDFEDVQQQARELGLGEQQYLF